MDLIAELKSVTNQLDAKGIPYALCGGLAVALHGYVRATQDIDLLVRGEDLNELIRAVAEIGYNLEGGRIPVGFGEAHPCDVHRISKAIGKSLVTLDLVIVNPSLKVAWESREKTRWYDEEVWVVSREGLGAMKRLSHRTIDLADLEQLGIPTDES